MGTELALLTETVGLAEHFVKSGFFKDASDISKAVVKITIGREMGFSASASMMNIFITERGKLMIGSQLIAGAIKRSGKYNYRIVTLTDTECVIDFYENNAKIGDVKFTIEDAKRAGLLDKTGPWRTYPSDMLFSKTIARGGRRFCADLFGGMAIYSEGDADELGAVDFPRLQTGEKSKLETLGEFQIADKKGTLHSLNELAAENKPAYWKAIFNQSENQAVSDFLTEYIVVNGLQSIAELEGMAEFLVEYSSRDGALAYSIKKEITVEPPKETVIVDGKHWPPDERIGEQWDIVVQPIINSLMKPAERVPSLKAHGIKPPYAETTWRQMAEYIDYKLIQGVNPQSAPDYSDLDAAQTMEAWIDLLQRKDGLGLFDNAQAVLQLAGVDNSNIKSVHHELSQIVEAFTLGIVTYDLPQTVNAAIQLLKRKVMK